MGIGDDGDLPNGHGVHEREKVSFHGLHTLIKRVAIGLSLLLLPAGAGAQELTPGAYWPLPRGMNIVTVINSFNWGDVDFDPSVPVDQASARINTTALVYTRTLSIAGRSANIGTCRPSCS